MTLTRSSIITSCVHASGMVGTFRNSAKSSPTIWHLPRQLKWWVSGLALWTVFQTKQCKTCTASHGHAHCCSGSRTTNFAAVSRMIVYFVTYMVDVTWFNEPEKSSLARTSSPLSYVLRETMSCEYVLKMITWFIGVRTNAMDMDFSAVLPEEVASELKTAAEISMGTEVSDEDINNIKYLCDQVIIWSRFPQVSCTNLSLQCCSRWC